MIRVQIPVHRGQSYRRITDSIPWICGQLVKAAYHPLVGKHDGLTNNSLFRLCPGRALSGANAQASVLVFVLHGPDRRGFGPWLSISSKIDGVRRSMNPRLWFQRGGPLLPPTKTF